MPYSENFRPPYLDEATVRRHLTMPALIDAMSETLKSYSERKIIQPNRRMLPVKAGGGFIGSMFAVGEHVGVKLISFFPDNAKHDMPTHLGIIHLFDPLTGHLLVSMDGRLITETRTAAVTAAALRALDLSRAKTLAVLGTGVQATVHLEALSHVKTFEKVCVWGRTPEKVAAFAERTGAVAMSAEEAVRQADVVITTTSSKQPVLEGAWLKPGALVAAVGWNSVDGRELDDDAMRHKVLVECRSAAADEAGNIRGSKAEIFAEVGEIIAGSKTCPPGETVIFDSIGIACEDVAAATLVWNSYQAVDA